MSSKNMFIILLRFTGNNDLAAQLMDAHMTHVRQGFSDGVFLAGGPIVNNLGGALIGHGVSGHEMEARVASDPFVKAGVVTPEIVAFSPLHLDEKLRDILPWPAHG